MSIKTAIDRFHQQASGSRSDAERYVLGHFATTAFLRAKQIDADLFPPSIGGFLSRAFKMSKQPDLSLLVRELEELVSKAKEANSIVQARLEREGSVEKISDRERIDLMLVPIAGAACDALRSYCHSMLTGEHKEHRAAFIGAYRQAFEKGMAVTIQQRQLSATQ